MKRFLVHLVLFLVPLMGLSSLISANAEVSQKSLMPQTLKVTGADAQATPATKDWLVVPIFYATTELM